ncbi:hypothetical protein EVAR_60536_1 [Eumeta japonica]|uniref:Uncharacterized protein n=1 Tax=Eumeta variegata TaxID=151549 RepID=A0A4C1YV22_EUMVA|nr:hypothetical protein EVAR_60536_1 [Eumeta japonica]
MRRLHAGCCNVQRATNRWASNLFHTPLFHYEPPSNELNIDSRGRSAHAPHRRLPIAVRRRGRLRVGDVRPAVQARRGEMRREHARPLLGALPAHGQRRRRRRRLLDG